MVENAVAEAFDPTPSAQVPVADANRSGDDIVVSWTGANSLSYRGLHIYLGTSPLFVSADFVATRYGAANAADTYRIEELDHDSDRIWVTSINGSGIEATPPESAGGVTIPEPGEGE